MQEKSFMVKIDKIEVADFSIKRIPLPMNTPLPSEYNFTLAITNKVVPAHKLIIQNVDISLDAPQKENEVLASISILIGYLISNFDEAIKSDKNNVFTIDNDLDLMIRNISIGTSRGIFYSKLQGSYLQGAVLPIILNSSFQSVNIPVNQ